MSVFRKIIKWITIVLVVLFVITFAQVVFNGNSSENREDYSGQDIEDQIGNILQQEDEHVQMVKNGYPEMYPDLKYGEVFEAFFSNPTWTYFHAETGEDVVEFTGNCIYRDQEVKARLQFILDMENNTFQAGALSFNDVPQTELITSALISTAFQSYQEENSNITNNETNSSNNAESPESEYSWEGTWEDTYSQRCHMDIVNIGDRQYSISINWSSSAFENSCWEMTGAYDASTSCLEYSDCTQYSEIYLEDGNLTRTPVYENGTGRLYIQDAYLYWEDDIENIGANCCFVRL